MLRRAVTLFAGCQSWPKTFHRIPDTLMTSRRAPIQGTSRRAIHQFQRSRIVDNSKDSDVKSLKTSVRLNNEEACAAINNLQGEDKKRLEIVKLEYEVWLASGHTVPENISDSLWWELYNIPNENQRKRLLRYFFKIELSYKKKALRKDKDLEERQNAPQPLIKVENGFSYTLPPNGELKQTMFLKLLKNTTHQHYYSNIYNALLYGSKIVFDMSYDSYMRNMDITNLVDQLLECHGHNKVNVDPFYFYFCNFKKDSSSYRRMELSAGTSARKLEDYPFTLTEESYLDLFPRERLIYLSPQAPDMLETYDRNDIFIIGGLVDKVITKPVSMAKAKREGIRMAKFPMDLYLKFVRGNKSLTLDQTMRILLDFKNTGNWRHALRHIPLRKRIFFDEM